MNQVVKSFLGIFFLLVLLFTGVGIISAQIHVSAALDYKSAVVTQLENSNYSPAVMNACITQATESGYTLEIRTFSMGNAVQTYTAANVTDTSDVIMAEVILNYPYEIPFLQISVGQQVRGYAR